MTEQPQEDNKMRLVSFLFMILTIVYYLVTKYIEGKI